MEKEGIKENGGGGDSGMIYKFCKCHNVLPPSTTIRNSHLKRCIVTASHSNRRIRNKITQLAHEFFK
jgi:hypothetical protein